MIVNIKVGPNWEDMVPFTEYPLPPQTEPARSRLSTPIKPRLHLPHACAAQAAAARADGRDTASFDIANL